MRLIAVAMEVFCVAVRGQEFEVASVKPAPPKVPGTFDRQRGGPGTDDPGQITYPRISLFAMIIEAYDVDSDQVSGPSWIDSEEYSIQAKLPPNTSRKDFHIMLQHLLAERFHLALHHEIKDAPGYDLTVAPSGPNLKPAPPDDPNAKPLSPAEKRAMVTDPDALPRLAPGVRTSIVFDGRSVRLTDRMTMAEFAESLGRWIRLSNGGGGAFIKGAIPAAPRVADKTGLTGEFEFRLKFAAEMAPPRNLPILAGRGGDDPIATASDPSGGAPNIFSALKKQLGLKLVKAKNVSVDALIIDHVDRVPTDN